MASTGEPVPVEHLDYAFVDSCNDAKELERILKVLRSGKEGHYPDLISSTEKRLRQTKPKSLLLRKDQNAVRSSDLPQDERLDLLKDLENWSQSMVAQEERVKQEMSKQAPTVDIPIRGSLQARENGEAAEYGSVNHESSLPSSNLPSASSSGKKADRIKAYDYRSWDKFDPDSAAMEEAASSGAGRKAGQETVPSGLRSNGDVPGKETDAQRLAGIASSHGMTASVSTEKKTAIELEHMSRIAKEKGNEAYRAGDCEEALVYYTHSIQYTPSVPSYNNRALAALKLRLYDLAEEDTTQVLAQDSRNVKALVRRAEARQYLWKYPGALADVRAALAIEPGNKVAQDLLPFLERETRPVAEPYDKAVFEDAEPTADDSLRPTTASQPIPMPRRRNDSGSDSSPSHPQDSSSSKKKKRKKGKSLTISEINGDDSPSLAHRISTSPSKRKGGKSPQEPPKCTPKTAKFVQPVGILKRTASDSSPVTPDEVVSPGGRRGLHWADTLTCSSPTASYAPSLAVSPPSPGLRNKGMVDSKAQGLGGGGGGAIGDRGAGLPPSNQPLDDGMTPFPPRCDVIDGAAGSKPSVEVAHPTPESTPQSVGQSSVAESTAGPAQASDRPPTVGPSCTAANATETSEAESAPTAAAATTSAAVVAPASVVAPTVAVVAEPEPLPPAIADLKEKGNALFKSGNYHAAMETYSLALKKLGSDVKMAYGRSTLLNNRAACHSKLGSCSACIQDSSAVLEVQAGNGKAWMRRGDAYRALERNADAYADYQQVVRLSPMNSSNAQDSMTQLLPLLRDKFGNGWRSHLPSRPSVQTSASTATPTPTAVSTPAGSASSLSSDARQADHRSTKVNISKGGSSSSTTTTTATSTSASSKGSGKASASAKPSSSQPQSTGELYETIKDRGNEFVKKSQWGEAVYCYSSCISADASNPVAYTNRALCHLKLNKPEQAEVDCEKALQLDAKNVKALYRKALAQKAMYRYNDCVASLRQVVQLDRTNTAALKEVMAVTKLAKEAGQSLASSAGKTSGESSSRKENRKPAGAKTPASKEKERRRLVVQQVDQDSDEEQDLLRKATTESGPTSAAPREQRQNKKSKKGKSALTATTHDVDKPPKAADVAKPPKAAAKAKAEGKSGPGKNDGVKVRTQADIERAVPAAKDLSKMTPYEFMQAWSSVKHGDKLLQYYHILAQITPSKLPSLVSSKLDGDMMMAFVRVLAKHYLPAGEQDAIYEFLTVIPSMSRFNTVSMFLSIGDKIEISRLLRELALADWAQYSQSDLDTVAKAFGL